MHRFLTAFVLGFLSCTVYAASEPPHVLLALVPQSDESAIAGLKLLERYPTVRLVLALSPRFQRLNKDAVLKQQMLDLEKQGRLRLALQIPNAPILPLVSEADAIEHISRAKANFVRAYGVVPTGIIPPYGAVNEALLKNMGRLSLQWTVAALGSTAAGPWKPKSFLGMNSIPVWDGAAQGTAEAAYQVRVWDERDIKTAGGKPLPKLEQMLREAEAKKSVFILPTDPDIQSPWALEEAQVQARTWTAPDWSQWTGSPEKDALWAQLARTRQDLEAYKNSGSAAVARLDAALDEFYTAQNSNFLAAAGNTTLPELEREERLREFQATLENVYRLMGKTPPDDLFKTTALVESPKTSTAAVVAVEALPDGTQRLRIARAEGVLRLVEILISSDTLTWNITLSTGLADRTLDLYIDINGMAHVGTVSALPKRALLWDPVDAWEYAWQISASHAQLYRTQNGGSFGAGSFPVDIQGSRIRVQVPRDQMRGNLKRWGVQALLVDSKDQIQGRLSEGRFVRASP